MSGESWKQTLLNHRHSKERRRLYYPKEDSLTDWLTDISISHLCSFTLCFWSKGRFFILEKFLRETTYFQYNLLRSRDGSYRRDSGGNLAVFYERHFAGRESERHKCGAMRLRWSLLAMRKSPLPLIPDVTDTLLKNSILLKCLSVGARAVRWMAKTNCNWTDTKKQPATVNSNGDELVKGID